MSTATKTTTVWSVEQWSEFLIRARDVERRLWWTIDVDQRRFPGWRLKIGDLLCKSMNLLGTGIYCTEELSRRPVGCGPIRWLFDSEHVDPSPPVPPERSQHLPEVPQFRKPKRGTILSLGAWKIEGRHWKELRADLFSLIVDLNEAFPKTKVKRAMLYLGRADGALTSAKGQMESLLAKQHPDVVDPASYFFGPGSEVIA